MARSNKSPTTPESLDQQQQQQQQSGRIAVTASLASQGGCGVGDGVASSDRLLSAKRHSGEGGGEGRRWRLAAAVTTVVLVSLIAVGVL